MDEIWKEIEGYDGDYLISNLGKVRSLKYKNPKILKPGKNMGGYYYVILCKNNIPKTSYLHRLVAENFIPNPDNKLTVNHLDANKLNNNVTNLEWATSSENNQHAWDQGLMENTRKSVKKNISIANEARKIPIYSKDLDLKFESCTEAATYIQTHYFENITLGCLKSSICSLLNNKITKSKFDFGWKYN